MSRPLLTIDTLGTRHERHARDCAIFAQRHVLADCTCGAEIIWPEQARPVALAERLRAFVASWEFFGTAARPEREASPARYAQAAE